jgi:hypothetical protein
MRPSEESKRHSSIKVTSFPAVSTKPVCPYHPADEKSIEKAVESIVEGGDMCVNQFWTWCHIKTNSWRFYRNVSRHRTCAGLKKGVQRGR